MTRAFVDAVKANDPAQHRAGRTSDVSSASLSPKGNPSFAQSGRRSVAGRPPSVASTSSTAGATPGRHTAARAKTPSARPASRQSDVFIRSSSRIDRSFDVGDNVRIESLGFEGTLRYLGEIDGKAGQWAGVELSGGFAGMGKNDGAVNGKHYFVCPPKCGVFVATTKLSAPTVGTGAMSRPSSVASSRGGRITPSFSGQITPSSSISAGRFTPYSSTNVANGRVTPVSATGKVPQRTVTPSARVRTKTGPSTAVPFSTDITNGFGHGLARQISADSPTRGMASPSASPSFSTPSSPSFRTPKPGLGNRTTGVGVGLPSTTPTKGRQSLLTPRGRIPSSVAMPPPASPATPGLKRTVSLNDYASDTENPDSDALHSSDLESNARAIQGRIAHLLSGKSPSGGPPIPSSVTSPTLDALSVNNTAFSELKARADALEAENEELKVLVSGLKGEELEAGRRSDSLREDRDRALARVADLESSVKTAERSLHERELKIEAMERAVANSAADVEKVRSEGEARVRDMQSRLDDTEALLKNLKEVIAQKEGVVNENTSVLNAKDAEIGLLEARVKKAYAELEDERRELGGQVDALRQAGQETIALYEERLSAAESQRYDMEDLIASLQEQLRSQAERPSSPTSAARYASSAAQIENETLREQVLHLQKKLATMEDTLEDSRAVADREELLIREKIRRYKDKEDNLKKQVSEAEKEVERVLKSEASARGRLEEVEEAFRESTVALESSQAEIETLRAEIADLESINSSTTGSSERLAEIAQRAASDRTKAVEEIAQLKTLVEDLRRAQHDAPQNGGNRSDGNLQDVVDELTADNTELRRVHKDLQLRLADEESSVAELRERLEKSYAELESTRRKVNREAVVADKPEIKRTPSSSSRHESSAVREEIAGLKHIIQELQKENNAAAQQYKLLESENKLLLSETEQLREDMKLLEDSVENSIMREEQSLNEAAAGPNGDSTTLQRAMKEMRLKHEMELEQLRKRQSEAEIKTARTIHDLNKEVSELESLIESKIYREDELEQEVERLKEKLSRSQKKSSKSVPEVVAASGSADSLRSMSDDGQANGQGDVCEICEQPGHDIFTCDLLKGGSPAVAVSESSSSGLYCEECEGQGHVAADCPHSMDVF
ncbi:hypothetical protein BV25DRAFT_1816286 [Artomyces pyxidatus]|uniref:Uncharacterized protein n=1 Tax=Artomyces pyxidatus TaxID=48021 RepID=A0ACB8SGE5_9AGAM|nr:hypothetical protein BV25DRAFT_1816286 [Artomyces pyxidatus]